MFLIRVLSFIGDLRFNVGGEQSLQGGWGERVGRWIGGYQPGVYVPLKALFIAPAYSRVRYRSSNFHPSVRSFVRSSVRSFVRSSVNIYVEV